MGRGRAQLTLIALLLAAALASGCGDDDEPAPSRTETAPGQSRTPTAGAREAQGSTDTGGARSPGAPGDAKGGGLPDTCELLSASEVRAASGRDVDPREERGRTIDGYTYRECSWTAVGFEASAAVRVVSSAKRYDTLLRDLGGAGAEITKLSGPGDAAFVAQGFSGETSAGTRGATIFAKSGGSTFSIALSNAQKEGPRDELVALMEKMLARAR